MIKVPIEHKPCFEPFVAMAEKIEGTGCVVCHKKPSVPLVFYVDCAHVAGQHVQILQTCGKQCRVLLASSLEELKLEFPSVKYHQEEGVKLASMCCHLCQVRETTTKFKSCARCGSLRYCSKECQKMDWTEHKITCGKIFEPLCACWTQEEIQNIRQAETSTSCFGCNKTMNPQDIIRHCVPMPCRLDLSKKMHESFVPMCSTRCIRATAKMVDSLTLV